MAWWIAIKVVFYLAMAVLAIRMLRLTLADPLGFVVKCAVFRLVLGLLMGLLIAQSYAALSKGAGEMLGYLLTFGVFRYFEWLGVLFVIVRRQPSSAASVVWRGQAWILVGVAGNIVLDLIAMYLVLPTLKFYC